MTLSKEELSALIERVRGLKGADRYTDCHLWVLAQGGDARMRVCDSSTKDFVRERGIDGFWVRGVVPFRSVPHYTGSVDAALALVERVRPGFSLRMATPDTTVIERNPMGRAAAELVPNLHSDDAWQVGIKSASGATLPLATLLALLLSLQSQDPTL